MKRLFANSLDNWLTDSLRKPLILRGARQVGKTWLVRDLAERWGRKLVEINFERDSEAQRMFASNDPRVILGELSLAFNHEIEPDKCLLFLDEIQAASHVIAKLRWFAEELPALPVVAAGSLLDFALADHDYSMPVGRVEFRYMEPMGFAEYLVAHGLNRLLQAISEWHPGKELSPTAHEQAEKWFHRFSMVGGMPEVVAADVAGVKPSKCRQLQGDLMETFRSDFSKYSGRMQPGILDAVLRSVMGSIGRKFIYAQADNGVKNHQAKQALDLLAKSRVCHVVNWSAGNSLPLASEMKDNFRKAVLLDVGLLHALSGTPAADAFPALESLAPDLRARMAEQLAAQHLRLLDGSGTTKPELFYWQREGGRPGEIDYLCPGLGKVLPIELKSGAAGRMRSLHQFIFEKKLELAVRSDSNPPGIQDIDIKTTQGDPVKYRLLNIPLYLLWNLPNILSKCL